VARRFGAEGYQFEIVEGWPQVEVKGVAASVALDSRGRAYVGVRDIPASGGFGNILPGKGHILVLNPDGTVHGTWDMVFSSPHAVWISPSDEVFVADTGLHTITKHTLSGEVLLTLGTPGQAGAPGQPFNMPTGAVEAPNGEIVVSDGYGQNWMHKFSAKGEHILSWGGGDPVFIQLFHQRSGGGGPVTGTAATEPGKFNLPHDVHVDPSGKVYVMDRENRRWQVFTLDGEYLSQVNDVNNPCDVAVDADGIFHIVGGGGVSSWTTDGTKLSEWGEKGAAPGQFLNGPHGCWIDPEGSLYIGEVGGNNRLQKFRRL
jgi:DNA-binding beta-propeller fold protein YncE